MLKLSKKQNKRKNKILNLFKVFIQFIQHKIDIWSEKCKSLSKLLKRIKTAKEIYFASFALLTYEQVHLPQSERIWIN